LSQLCFWINFNLLDCF